MSNPNTVVQCAWHSWDQTSGANSQIMLEVVQPYGDSSYMASNEKMQKNVQGFCASGFITFSNLSVQGRRKRCGGSRDLASTWDGNRMNHAICHELTGFSGLYDVTSKERALLSICGVGLEWSQKDQVDSGHGHVDVPFDHG